MSVVETVKTGDILDDRYELTEIVGRGGCGTVFRATDLNLDREVAIKVLSAEGECTQDMITRFERESQILRHLHAPNTVFFYDIGQTPQGLPYIAMEFVSGKQLKDLLDETHALTPEVTVQILIQVFQSLVEAHSYGFVHRDLKPANIMLCDRIGFPGYFVKVLDFGVAKIISEDDEESGASSEASKSDNMAGTPRYMAPEQFKNEIITPSADLYSMGCIAYEMLTGVAPFDGDTIHVTVAKHLFMTPKSLGAAFDQYPNLEATIFKLLEKQPQDRFASAQDVIDVLEHWQDAELCPELQNCRTHGDDDAENAFNTDDNESHSGAIPQAYAEAMHNVRLKGIYAMPQEHEPEVSPLAIAAAEHRELLESQYALTSAVQKKEYFRVGVIIAIVFAFIAIAFGATLFFEDDPSDTAQSYISNTQITAAETIKQKIEKQNLGFFTDIATDELAQSALISIGFGILSKKEIEKLPTEFDDRYADAVHDEDKSSKSSKKRKHRSRNGQSKRAEPKANAAPDELELFTFKLQYSPSNARVGFLNALGQCKDGTCRVRTTSTKNHPRIVVSAMGYETQSIVVDEKVDALRIALVPEE